MHVNEKEKAVLACLALSEFCGSDFGYLSFAGIEQRTGLSRKEVKRACRSLAKKGFAEFGRGLFNDEGEVCGSGYCATRAGAEIVA